MEVANLCFHSECTFNGTVEIHCGVLHFSVAQRRYPQTSLSAGLCKALVPLPGEAIAEREVTIKNE
jgi:hypothetical protein